MGCERGCGEMGVCHPNREDAIKAFRKGVLAYHRKMKAAAEKPHPISGKQNTVALCKQDAAESLLDMFERALDDPQQFLEGVCDV